MHLHDIAEELKNIREILERQQSIEVSEDNQVLYGTDHNCILTMFGECSYNETGCSDCAVAEKIRKALSVEVSEDCTDYYKGYCARYDDGCFHQCKDCISREWLISFIDAGHLRNPNEKCYSENDVVELIKNAPSVTTEQSSKVGEWVLDEEDSTFLVYRCSECNAVGAFTNYCPNCGAKMKGADDE